MFHKNLYFVLAGTMYLLLLAVLPAYALGIQEHAGPIRIQKEGEKYGLVNEQGKQVLPARYDSLQYTSHQDFYIAYLQEAGKKKLVGLINLKGKEIIPIRYSALKAVSHNRYAVSDANRKTALFDAGGLARTAFEFDEITAFQGKLSRFYQQGKAGILDSEGRIRLKAEYQDIIIRSNEAVDVIPLRTWTITDGNNKLLHTLSYDSIRPLGEDRWAATTRFYDSVGRATTMTALTDASGNMLVPYRSMFIDDFQLGVARVREGKHYGLIDNKGNYILPAEWDSLAIVQGVAVAGMRVDTKWYWHLFNLKGKKQSRFTYQHIIPVAEGPMPAKRENQWGYVDHTGSEILICRYDTTFAFQDGLARVRFSGQEGIINQEGLWQIRPVSEHVQILTPTRFLARLKKGYQLLNEQDEVLFQTAEVLKPLKGGLAEINALGKWGLISMDGKRLSFPVYDYITDLQEDQIFIASLEGKRGILSADGSKFIAAGPKTWDRLYSMSEGFIGAQIGRQQGFVDANGLLRIANRYDTVSFFSDGMAAVAIRGKWGYVDKIERLRVQPSYDQATAFKSGTAIVQQGSKRGVIDNKGKFLLPLEYKQIVRLTNGRFLLQQENLFGLADAQGNRIITPKYDAVQDLQNGYLLVSRGGKKGLVTIDGVGTIPLIYDVLVYDRKNDLYLCTQERASIQRIALPQP